MGKEKAGRIFKAGGIAYAKVLKGSNSLAHLENRSTEAGVERLPLKRPMEGDK